MTLKWTSAMTGGVAQTILKWISVMTGGVVQTTLKWTSAMDGAVVQMTLKKTFAMTFQQVLSIPHFSILLLSVGSSRLRHV